MAAGTFTIREIDYTPQALLGWQCLKAPVTAAETALTAAKLMEDMRSVVPADDNNYQVIPVSMFDRIRVMVLANGSNDQSPVLNLFGWGSNGPGHLMGVVTTDLGNFTSAASTGFHASARTHKSIRDAFAAATAWRSCDINTVTADYGQERFTDGTLEIQFFKTICPPGVTSAGTAAPLADHPTYFDVDFSHADFSFFGVSPSALDSATSVGAIFRPIRLKGGLTSPGGA